MAFTHRVGSTYTTNAGTTTSVTNTYTGDGEEAYDIALAGNATDTQVNAAFPYQNIKSYVLYSSDTNVTIKTNNSGAPDDTISLVAGVQKIYTNDGAAGSGTNLFTANVTALYLTNAHATTATTVKIRVLRDSTP